jgi:heme exporter protein D
MIDAGPHAAFIWSAYGVTAAVAAALVGRAVLDSRAQKRALARLEAERPLGERRPNPERAGG